MDIKGLFSERALENEKFTKVIIEPTEKEFNLIKPFIDSFPDLITLDYVNSQFIALLGDFLGFDYLETESVEVQREIMKRVIDEYHRKGDIQQIYKAANRAYDDNYFLGDLTYYRHKIVEGYSQITYPRDRMFRYDRSRWDMGYRWPDFGRNMIGVMEISMSNANDRTLQYLDRLVPGGIRFYVDILRDISSTGDGDNEDAIYYPYEIYGYEAEIWLDILQLKPYYEPKKIFLYDKSKWDEAIVSGEQHISFDQWEERPVDGVAYNVLFPSDEMYVVATFAEDDYIYNINRFKGYLDGQGKADIPGVVLSKQVLQMDESPWDSEVKW